MEDSFFDSLSSAQWYGENVGRMMDELPYLDSFPVWGSKTPEEMRAWAIEHRLKPYAKSAWHHAEKATALAKLYF